MSPLIYSAVYALAVLGLCYLNWDRKAHTSPALWLPVLWVCIGGSRMVSQWLDASSGKTVDPEQYLEGNPLDRIVLTGILVLGVAILMGRYRKVLPVLKANWPIVVFFLYCLVSVSWSEFPDVAFKRWIKSLSDLAMVLLILTENNRTAAIKRFLGRSAFILIPASIVLIKYYPDLGRTYDRWEGTMALTGVATDKNMLGLVCMVFGIGTVWRFLVAFKRKDGWSKKGGPVLAELVLLGMTGWLLYKANSMTSISCFLFGSTLMFVTSFPTFARKRWLTHVMVVGMLATSVSALFFHVGTGLVEAAGRNSTLTGRTDLWAHLLPMVQNPMLGTGFGSFWLGPRIAKLWAIYWWHPNESHNGYLENYLNLGWTGLLLLGIVFASGYRNILNMLRQEREVGMVCLAYFVAGLAYNFTEAGFRTMNLIWIVFLLAVATVPRPQPKKAAVLKTRMPAKFPERPVLREEVV
jgi:exopolysaccharide production protein ExoQ